MTQCVRWGGPWPHRGRGDLGSKPQPKQAIANCSQTVNPVLSVGWLATAIPLFAKLHWSLLYISQLVSSLTSPPINFLLCNSVICMCVKGSIYGDWCRKHSQRSQRSQRADDESRYHHHYPTYHHRHRQHQNNCREDHVTQVDSEQLPLPVYDCNHEQPEQHRDEDVIELNTLPWRWLPACVHVALVTSGRHSLAWHTLRAACPSDY